MRVPISWKIEQFMARRMAKILRKWGKCETSDLEDFPDDIYPGLEGRCCVCLANEAADRLDRLYLD